ncbi:hypothetical protein, partial, partial [Parasitella parasitica]
DSQITEEEVVQLKQKFAAIKTFLDANADTFVASHTTFDEFLQQIQVSSAEAYFRCIRATLKTAKVFLKRQPREILINNYSRKILSSFRSNGDIQFVLCPYSCATYIADYINKADRGLSVTIKEIYERQRQNPQSTPFETLRSVASTYYNASEISAQEAAYNLCRLRMSEASIGCIFIPTARPELRQKILRKRADLATRDPQSVDCLQPGLIEHYIARPREFNHLNLAQFAAYFEISSKKPATVSNSDTINLPENEEYISNSNFSGESGKWYQLKAGSPQVYIRRRKSSKVIRYYKYNQDGNPAEYYRTLLMLYRPWRDEERELLSVDCEAHVASHREEINTGLAEFCVINDDRLDQFFDQVMRDRAAERDANSEEGDDEDEQDEDADHRRHVPVAERLNDFD